MWTQHKCDPIEPEGICWEENVWSIIVWSEFRNAGSSFSLSIYLRKGQCQWAATVMAYYKKFSLKLQSILKQIWIIPWNQSNESPQSDTDGHRWPFSSVPDWFPFDRACQRCPTQFRLDPSATTCSIALQYGTREWSSVHRPTLTQPSTSNPAIHPQNGNSAHQCMDVKQHPW